MEAMASKRLFPGGAFAPSVAGGHFRVLALALPDGERQARKRAPIMPTPKALGRLSEKPASAYRTPIEPTDENAAEKKMSHDIPVSNDL